MERARPSVRSLQAIALTMPIIALAAVVLVATRLPSGGRDLERSAQVIPPGERVPAPTAEAPRLLSDGRIGLHDLRGKVVVLNFWASWCGPCRREQPELNDAHAELAGPDVAFLGVDLQDTQPNARAHMREFDVPYDSLFDPASSYAARFEGVGPKAIPTTIVIDRKGRIAARIFGATTKEELVGAVRRVLEE